MDFFYAKSIWIIVIKLLPILCFFLFFLFFQKMNKASGSKFTINFRVGAQKTFSTKILFVFCTVK